MVTGLLVISAELSGPTVSGLFVSSAALEATTTGILPVVCRIGGEAVLRPAPSWDITLAGASIKGQVEQVSCDFTQTSPHDGITITAADPDLYRSLRGGETVTVTLEGTDVAFLVEDTRGHEHQFEAWGRTVSCLHDTPYAPETTVTAGDGQYASALAALTIPGCTWTGPDYLVQAGASITGTPLGIVQQLAAEVGSMVRGTTGIVVAPLWPVAPTRLYTLPPDLYLDRLDNMLTLSTELERRSNYNRVTVSPEGSRLANVPIEVEGTPVAGQPVYLRAWLSRAADALALEGFCTAGTVFPLGTVDGSETTTVAFRDLHGNGTHPARTVTAAAWTGISGGTATATDDGGIAIDGGLLGIARGMVTYDTRYARYRVDGLNVEATFILAAGADGAITVTRGAADNPAPDLGTPLIADRSGMIAAGTAYLRENGVDLRRASVQIPLEAALFDGIAAGLSDEGTGINGVALVRRVTWDLSAAPVATLEVACAS